ncbi:MAG: type II CAAX endopeptidase family protein [Pseudomonadota bacterium]
MADPYAAHDRFVAPAGDGGPPRRLVFAAIVIDIGWFALVALAFSVLPLSAAEGTTRAGLLFGLLFFAVLMVLTGFVSRRLHNRRFLSLFGDFDRLLPDMVRVAGACLALAILLIFLSGWDLRGIETRPLAAWLAFLPFVVLALLVQCLAEEVLYRGYLQQTCAALFKSRALWLLVPSVWFGLAHYDPASPGAEAWAYVLWASFFGLACADLTARTGSIGAALGLHLTNNIMALCVTAEVGGQWSAAALFLTPAGPEGVAADPAVVWIGTGYELIILAITWLAARNAIAR